MTAQSDLSAPEVFSPRPSRRAPRQAVSVRPVREAGRSASVPWRRPAPFAATAWTVDLGLCLLVAASAAAVGVPERVAVGTLLGWCGTRVVVRDTVVRRVPLRVHTSVRAFVTLLAATALLVAVVGADRVPLHQVVAVAAAVAAASVAVGVGLRWLRGPVRVLVVGGPEAARAEAARGAGRGSGRRGWQVVGRCAVDPGTGEIGPARPWPGDGLAGRLDLVDAVASWRVDVVAVAPRSGLDATGVRTLGWQLEGHEVDLAFLDDLASVAPHRLAIGHLGGRPLVLLSPSRPGPVARSVKLLLDRVLAAALLVVLLPLLVVLAVLVRCDSRGPALFRQTRIGLDGRPFTILKLRTMHQHAERLTFVLAEANEADAVLFKIRDDPRVTRLGRLLRRSSLDELPQLFNVVRGDMSLVGPRPALPQEVAQYDDVARRRLAVRPGITGLWQVNGRSDLDWARTVDLDVHYTDNITISGDLAICLRTVRAVAGGRGAY